MWVIWIYFFLSSSGALGEEEIKSDDELFCKSFQGFEDESNKEPTHDFKFVLYDTTYIISRNDEVDLPCLFRNLDGYDIVWRKGEKVICDADKLATCKNSTCKDDGPKYSLAYDTIICDYRKQPGQHLIIRNAQHEDAGEYICEVKSSPPRVLSKIKVKVVDTEFLTVNQTFSVAEGDTVTLPCDVTNLGTGYFPEWYFNYYTDHNTILYNQHQYFTFQEPFHSRLKLVKGARHHIQIQNITQSMAGDYSCVLDTTPPKVLTHKVIVN